MPPFTEDMIPFYGMASGVFIATIALVGGYIVDYRKTAEQERSRRELAAYVAEGAMTTEQAERLLAQKPAKSLRTNGGPCGTADSTLRGRA